MKPVQPVLFNNLSQKSNYLQKYVFPLPAAGPLLIYGLPTCQKESAHLNWGAQFGSAHGVGDVFLVVLKR